MAGNPEAFERDKRLGARIRELAGPSREERAAQLREAWLRNHPGGDE
jgi:aryl-alcohol dehydrogenase-like predicted oxidoreductase